MLVTDLAARVLSNAKDLSRVDTLMKTFASPRKLKKRHVLTIDSEVLHDWLRDPHREWDIFFSPLQYRYLLLCMTRLPVDIAKMIAEIVEQEEMEQEKACQDAAFARLLTRAAGDRNEVERLMELRGCNVCDPVNGCGGPSDCPIHYSLDGGECWEP